MRTVAESPFGTYRPLPGLVDEMVDATGAPRPHWRPLVDALSRFGGPEITRRFDIAERHLRDSGVFYRVYDGGDERGIERPWPLAHLPLVIDPEEWRALSAALVERVGVIEAMLADLYGPGDLVASGVIPAAAVAGSPEFLRPLVGIAPRGGRFLRLYAADVGRGPDGRWRVLSDRTQAPSGMGYALENRLALARALPDVYRDMGVERVASFFQAFRAALTGLAPGGEGPVGLLTPGPLNETYFEHAYLARYLGFLLVEGGDLTVRGDTVFLRTVAGLKPAGVIWRRLDADYADPLELNAASRLGVPGLVRAIRAGHVAVANALGSGLAEARAVMAHVPAVARQILGRDLAVEGVATIWAGDPQGRARLIEELDQLVVAPAFGERLPGVLDRGPVAGAELDGAERRRLLDHLERRGTDITGQEIVHLATTPVWTGEGLVPRPFVLRLFVAATEDGLTVMPGGLCRISDRDDPRAVAMQRGGRAADVWVPAGGPVVETSLLPAPGRIAPRRITGPLPSRVADNLFWLGRYLERTEATLRLVRTLVGRLADGGRGESLARRIAGLLVAWGAIEVAQSRGRPDSVAALVLTSPDVPGAIPSLVGAARGAGSVIRDRLSADAWRALDDLGAFAAEGGVSVPLAGDAFERSNRGLRICAALAGLAQENMNRVAGWRFFELGKRIERAIATTRFVRGFGESNASAESLDVLLELADSQITYRARYVMVSARSPVVDLVLLDAANPRSVAFQVERIGEHLAALAEPGDGFPTAAQRLATRLHALLVTGEAARIDAGDLVEIERLLMAISDETTLSYFTHRGQRIGGWEGLG